MDNIIEAVDKQLLINELTTDKFLRKTNFGDNELYIFNHHNAPNLLREVGRLREHTFRAAGGGTGKSLDIDQYDTQAKPYNQLIVWDPREHEILGGYRFISGAEAPTDENNVPVLATSQLFYFSENFKTNYLPNLIELGRSFVVPSVQATGNSRRGLFALDNLWDGLGALIVKNPNVKYFFGKVTMYRHYNQQARNMILYFMDKYFKGDKNLIHLIEPLELNIDIKKMETIFTGKNYNDNYKILSKNVRALGENIPPLINAYMGLSPTLKVFGTSLNPYFGGVEETAILLTIADIYDEKSKRHVKTFNA